MDEFKPFDYNGQEPENEPATEPQAEREVVEEVVEEVTQAAEPVKPQPNIGLSRNTSRFTSGPLRRVAVVSESVSMSFPKMSGFISTSHCTTGS